MSVLKLVQAVQDELAQRVYLRRVEVLDQIDSLIKLRLQIASDLFVQIYRNDRFDTTNFVLIHNGQRLYARDQVGSRWHRHTHSDPEQPDISPEGRRPIDLPEFLDEVETILATLGLP
jgi:hypothetical protein